MILKTVLDSLRHFITYLKDMNENNPDIYKSHISSSLSPLVKSMKDDNDDFFASFLWN
jgi:hypothetical protein